MREALFVPTDIQLWDADHIAGILSVKAKYFKEHIAPAPGFPQAIRLPLVGGGRTTPRWQADEVIEWIESNKDRRAA